MEDIVGINCNGICNTVDQEYWVPDQETYAKLHKLKKFVSFIASLPFLSEDDQLKADEVIFMIDNIDKPQTFRNWSVCLDISDHEFQNHPESEIYLRKWWVFFEMGCLLIEADYEYTDPSDCPTGYFHYHGCVYFHNDFPGQRVFLETDPDEFVQDAINYQNYLSETLNRTNAIIDIWDN